jgi:hypothetical protein
VQYKYKIIFIYLLKFLLMLTTAKDIVNFESQISYAQNHAISIVEFDELLTHFINVLQVGEHLEISLPKPLYQYLISHKRWHALTAYAYDYNRINILPTQNEIITYDAALLTNKRYTLDMLSHKLNMYYYHLNKEVGQGQPFADMIHNQASSTSSDYVSLFPYYKPICTEDYQTYLSLYNKIKELYRHDESITSEESVGLKTTIDISTLSEKIPILEEVRYDLAYFFDQLHHRMAVWKKLWTKEAIAQYHLVYDSVQEISLQAAILQQNVKSHSEAINKPGLFSFSSAEKENFKQIEIIKQKIDILYDFLSKSHVKLTHRKIIKSIADIESCTDELHGILAAWKETTDKTIADRLSRINTQNLDDAIMRQAVDEIHSIINSINELEVFQNKWEINTTNYDQIIAEVHQISLKLENVVTYFNKYTDQIHWKNFYATLDSTKQRFVKNLLQYNINEWDVLFDATFTKRILDIYYHPILAQQENLVESYYNLSQEVSAIENIKLVSVLAHCTQKNKINLIKKHGEKTISATTDKQLLKQIFPIHIERIDDTAVTTISYTTTQGKHEYTFSINMDDKHHTIHSIQQSMSMVSAIEKYSIASTLSDVLLTHTKKFNVYQLKNANVLCCLPDALSQMLVGYLSHKGMKTFSTLGREKEAIIECIIEHERKPSIILANGLLNYHHTDTLFAQQDVIEAFKRVGFNVIHVWSADLLDGAQEEMMRVVNKIML